MFKNKSTELFHKLHVVSSTIHRSQKFYRGGLELERGQGRALRVLNKKDGISQSELAEKLNIRAASLSELIAKLEEKEHIIKKVDQDDKRRHIIFITENGREIANKTILAREEAAEAAFKPLTNREKEEFENLLDKLIISFKKDK